jgi:hypothetical protein
MAGPKRTAHDIDTNLKKEPLRKSPRKRLVFATRDRNPSSERAPARKAGKAKSLLKAPGMWQYSTGDKPTRTWIENNGVSGSEEETNGTNSRVFPAEKGGGAISYAYHTLWVAGHHQAFIDNIYK